MVIPSILLLTVRAQLTFLGVDIGAGARALAARRPYLRAGATFAEREQALSSFAPLGPKAAAAAKERARTSPWRPIRVVTDVDDTIKSSGNLRLAGVPLGGIDAQYERGQFYPGVCQFAFEIARYKAPREHMPLPVAVLTARAHELKFALALTEGHPVSLAYLKCGLRNGIRGWGLGPVYYGSVKEWICSERKPLRKVQNFNTLLRRDGAIPAIRGGSSGSSSSSGGSRSGVRIRGAGSGGGEREAAEAFVEPPCQYVFVGDTGEGDMKAGESMCRQHPKVMRGVFFHAVSCDGGGGVVLPPDRVVSGVPIVYFRTYVGAAAKAMRCGLMDERGLRRVIAAAREELSAAGAPPSASKWVDLERDISEALPQRSAPLAVVARAVKELFVRDPRKLQMPRVK